VGNKEVGNMEVGNKGVVDNKGVGSI